MNLGNVPLVLVIDDDPDQLELVRMAAARAGGIRVMTAASGPEAIIQIQAREALHLGPPDLILTDLKMPDMNGVELMRALRERPEFERVPVLFLTSSAYNRDRLVAHIAGADAFFQKPIQFFELVEMMKLLPSYIPHQPETEPEDPPVTTEVAAPARR